MGRISGKRQFLDLDTSASNTTELDPYKFTHFLLEVVRSMGSFGFQIWLERRSSRFSVSILEQKLNSAQASTLGEHFLASGPWIHQPMIHDVTKLKKRPRLGSLAARQTFFQAVDRLPRPGEVACIFSSLSSLTGTYQCDEPGPATN